MAGLDWRSIRSSRANKEESGFLNVEVGQKKIFFNHGDFHLWVSQLESVI